MSVTSTQSGLSTLRSDSPLFHRHPGAIHALTYAACIPPPGPVETQGGVESIAKSTSGKELERRIQRNICRREDSLRLIHEDLCLCQEELALSRTTLLRRVE
jgi:hypothetical protein